MYDVERIGKMRKQMGMTQKRLATLAGVSQSLIAKIESRNIDPAYSKVVQILGALENEGNREKKTAGQIMTAHISSVSPADPIAKAVSLMRSKDISQLPVLMEGKCVGSLSDSMILDLLATRGAELKRIIVGEVMADSFPVIPAKSVVDVAVDLLHHYRAVLVEKEGRIGGIITKADLLKTI
ncbi:MAG: CBS domain-containing protein [Candidatus Micrarchaeota archaeon]